MTIATLAWLIGVSSSPVFAQSPFDGTWALNQQKSSLTGETMTIEDAGPGAIKFVDPNFTYTVKTDGTKAETPSGATVAIQKQADGSYHRTVWRNGKELTQADWTLSDGDKTLTIHEFGTQPNGDKIDNTSTLTRVSGNKSLSGVWKTTAVKIGNPQTFTMRMGPGDQMTWDIPAIKGTWKGKTDGTESHPTGPTVPDSLTLAVIKQGPRAISMTEKLNGKTVFTGTYTVSDDAKTMTVEGKNAKGESLREVWDRQGS